MWIAEVYKSSDSETLKNQLNDRIPIDDLQAAADIGPYGQRIVQCDSDTLNTAYKSGLTGNDSSATAYINMSSNNYGTIMYIMSGSPRIFLRHKSNGIWHNWTELATKS